MQSRSLQPLSIQQLFLGTSKILENVQDHIDSADLLLQHQKYPGAFAFAHFACEEVSKGLFFLLLAYRIASGDNINWKKVQQQLRNHRFKVEKSLLIDLRQEFAPYGDSSIFSDSQEATELLNDLKNQSLYVSLIEDIRDQPSERDTFLKPSERIDPHVAQTTITRARKHLQYAQTTAEKWNELTGMTEEGLRTALAQPAFQEVTRRLEQEMNESDVLEEKQEPLSQELTCEARETSLSRLPGASN